MEEVDVLAKAGIDLLHLIRVENVGQISCPRFLIITCKLDGRKSELRLLHIIINCFVKVLTHVGLHNYWEMVSEPLALSSSL